MNTQDKKEIIAALLEAKRPDLANAVSFSVTAASPKLDRIKARNIVKRASAKVKNPLAKSWLLKDEKGTWEKEAIDLWAKASDHPKFSGMPDEQVEEELVNALSYMVLEAVKRRAAKGIDSQTQAAGPELQQQIRTNSIVRDFWGTEWKIVKYESMPRPGYIARWVKGPHKESGDVFVPLANLKEMVKAKALTLAEDEDWGPEEKRGQWNLHIRKSRATRWDYFLKNPQGGGFGSSSYTSIASAIAAATSRTDFKGADKIWIIISKWDPVQGDYAVVKSYWESVGKLQGTVEVQADAFPFHIPKQAEEEVRKVYFSLHRLKAAIDRMEEVPRYLQPVYDQTMKALAEQDKLFQAIQRLQDVMKKAIREMGL